MMCKPGRAEISIVGTALENGILHSVTHDSMQSDFSSCVVAHYCVPCPGSVNPSLHALERELCSDLTSVELASNF